MECPICKKDFNPETGRRPKKFCSDQCKVKFWNKFKGKEKPEINVQDANKQTNEVKPPEAPKTNYSINTEKIAELQKELELIPDIGLGKRRRAFLQNEIYRLKYPKT